jgi:glycosyltransferase involved in cell wall biosynthesis
VTALPRVSVVLPFRDAAATIDDALRSIATQSMGDFECILVANHSIDGSIGRAADIARRDPRFRAIASDGGLVDALNLGIAAARGGVIARMDADDVAHPRRLERQLRMLDADTSLALVSCLVECFPVSALRDGMRRYQCWLNGLRTPEAIRNAVFIESPIAHPSAVIRRWALEGVGAYRDTGGPEDYDLWLRLLLRGYRAAKVPEVLLFWRDSPRRLSRSDARCDRAQFLATKLAHFGDAIPPGQALDICGAGPTGRRWAAALGRRGYAVHRFIDVAPKRWGLTINGVPVCAPAALERQRNFVLAAAGSPGAREAIEHWLGRLGLQPWRDFLAVA